MAIHAKITGLLIGGKIVSEDDKKWVFKAGDNKSNTTIKKNDPKAKVFDGDKALDEAMAWQIKQRKAVRMKP